MTFIKLVPSLEEINLKNLHKIDAYFVRYGQKWGVVITLNRGFDNEYIITESDLSKIINRGLHPLNTTKELNRVRGYGTVRRVLDENGFRNFHDLPLFVEIYECEFVKSEKFENDVENGYSYPNHQIELEKHYEEVRAYYIALEQQWEAEESEWDILVAEYDEKARNEQYGE